MPIRPTNDAPGAQNDGLDLDLDFGSGADSLDDLVDQLGFLAAQSTLLTLSESTSAKAETPKVETKIDSKNRS